MKLSRGARRLVEHLKKQYCRSKRTCWPSRGRLARELHRDERTIYRWLRELVENQLIISDQRGHNSALLTLYPLCFEQDWLLNVRAVRAVSAAPLYEISIRKEKLASSQKPSYEAELIAELEARRVRLRPDWNTAQQAADSGLPPIAAAAIIARLSWNRGLSDRIRRARNPESYWFAVVAEELSKAIERKPAASEGLSLVRSAGCHS